MSKSRALFSSTDTGPPTVDFMFANPNVVQSDGVPRRRVRTSKSESNDPTNFVSVDADSNIAHLSTLPSEPRRIKPGPISKSELSSNAFKLRISNTPAVQSPTPKSLLRQEVFKTAHTLTPSSQFFVNPPSGRFLPALGVAPRNDPILKSSNKQVLTSRSSGTNTLLSTSSLKLESHDSVSIPPDAIDHTPDVAGDGHRRRSNFSAGTTISSRSITPLLTGEQEAPNIQPQESTLRSTPFSPARANPFRFESVDQTPLRRSVDHTTSSGPGSSRETHDLRRKCDQYEAELKFNRELLALKDAQIEDLSAGKTHAEENSEELKSKFADWATNHATRSKSELAELNAVHGQSLKASTTQIKQISNDVGKLREEARRAITAAESRLAAPGGFTEIRATLRELYEECEQLKLKSSNENIQLQQTIDLLRDELANVTDKCTQASEREAELRASMLSQEESHASVVKCLTALHEQHDQLTEKCSNLRIAESGSAERSKSLESEVSLLKAENARMKSLLENNEKGFSKKLAALEEENDGMRGSLAELHKELKLSRSGEQETLAQAQVLRQEKEELSRAVALLERESVLKAESLNNACAKNVALEQTLSDHKLALDDMRTENSHMKGQFVEIERTTSIRIYELNDALELSRKSEEAMRVELATLNHVTIGLRSELEQAEVVRSEHRALETALSDKCAEVNHLNAKITELQSQVAQAELARDNLAQECKTLCETSHVAREREAVAQRELQNLRGLAKEHQKTTEKASIDVARAEATLKQVQVTLAKEQECRQLAEKKLDASVHSLSKLQTEQKSALDKAAEIEKSLRLAINNAQDRIKGLESESKEKEKELKRLHQELNTSTTTKVTLENLVVDFRQSIQQANSSREKLELQENKIATLTSQVSGQKAEIRLLEQQLANADARVSEHQADINTHRITAESTRASAGIIENRLKERERELESIRAELQTLRTQPADIANDQAATSASRTRVLELEETIQRLGAGIAALEGQASSVLERYREGKLTDLEKDLVGEITTGIVQEKNRSINNLKGEIKRKESEIETHKITVTNLKDSLAKQIKQTADLKAQLAQNTLVLDDPSGWQNFNNKMMAVSSSPLSDADSHAPDHDEPTPDTPTPSERPIAQSSKHHEPPHQRGTTLTMKHTPQQQLRTFAQMDAESRSITDDIQEFDEPESARDSVLAGRKRYAVDAEPVEEVESEERETRRKAHAKVKKAGKAQAEINIRTRSTQHPAEKYQQNTKGQPLAGDSSGSSNAKGRPAKRRRV